MSTLDVACARCDKRFRVRAEFAGKATRCPGCSAPITIGGSKPAPPPREERAERPAPRPRPRDDEDDRHRRPPGDWRPVDSALGREQVAVVFALATVPCSYFAYCLGRAAGAAAGADAAVMVLTLLLVVGPSLVAGGFGAAARVAALGAPPETLARGTAVASLLCAIAGLLSILVFGLALLARLDAPPGSPGSGFLPVVATVGLVLSALGSVGTFAGIVAQIGIARRSAAVSAAVGRTAVTACVAVLAVTGLGLLLALAIEAASNPFSPRHEEEAIASVLFGVLIPVGFAAVLVAYHRLLAAARRAVQEGSA
jgi:hypothetical protein